VSSAVFRGLSPLAADMTETRTARIGRGLSDVSAIAAATVFLLLMWLLFSRPGSFGSDAVPRYLCCAAFAVLATASSVTAAKLFGRPVRLVAGAHMAPVAGPGSRARLAGTCTAVVLSCHMKRDLPQTDRHSPWPGQKPGWTG
jgi:hypothetical protein